MRAVYNAAVVTAVALWALPGWGQALDAAATVMKFESSGRNIQQQIVPLSVSTASGYYGITNTTWNTAVAPATGLPKVGPGTANPDGVMDLNAAQQYQGFVQLYSTQGFRPWTCTNCDAKLANYVAANGGAANFALQGDPNGGVTNPTPDIVAAEGGVSVADISVAGDGTGGTGGTSLTGGSSGTSNGLTGGGTGATTPVSSSTSPDANFVSPGAAVTTLATGTGALTVTAGSTQMSHPFAKSYSYVQTLISQIVQAQNQMLGAVQPAITIIAMLAIAIMGMLIALGVIGHSDVMLRWLRIIFVVGLLANTSDYNTYVTQLVLDGVPQWFAGIFYPGAVTSPADLFDKALSTYEIATMNIHLGIWNSIYMGLVEFAGLVTVFLSLAIIFVAFIVIQVLSALVLLVAPLVILGLMFEFTRRYVYGLVNALVDLALSALFINILVALITGIITQVIGSIQAGPSDWSTVFNLFGAVGTLVILGLLVPVSSRIVKGIAGAVATPHIPNPVAPAMAVVAAPAIAATSGPAAAAGVVTRAVAPVGRSLSLSSKGAS